jgi:KDO2-lipid IV(A) lauroyltransferase
LIKNFIAFVFYLGFKYFLLYSPNFIVRGFLFGLSRAFFYLDIRHKKITLANINFAYKNELNKKQKIQLAKDSYLHLAHNLYEFIINQNSSLEQMSNKIKVKNDKYILDAITKKQKIIITTAHYGSWELALPFLSLKYGHTAMIGKKIKNIFLDKIYSKSRANHNLEMFHKKGSLKHIIKALKDNKIIVVVIDQNIEKKFGVEVDFFNQKVTQTHSPISLASRFDGVIIPMFFKSNSINDNEMIFKKPIKIEPNVSKENILKYSQKLSNIIEKQVKQNPANWFWQHRRFKEFNSHIYN